MDKQASELLKTAKSVIAEQKKKITDLTKKLDSLNTFKLAFDIASGLMVKDQLDPADFQEYVLDLSQKEAKELVKKAELLSIESPDLDLGSVDDRDKTANSDRSMNFDAQESSKSPTPHSQESMEIARHLFSANIE